MNKKNIFILLIVILIFVAVFLSIKKDSTKTDTNLSNDVSEIENQVCTLESECTARGSVLEKLDEGIQTLTLEESLNHLNETCALFFSFEDCPWCYDAIQVLNNVYSEYDIPTYYVHIERSEREETNKAYLKVKSTLGIKDKMYVPHFTVLKDGKVLGFNVGTVSSHEKVDGVLPAINDMQKAELRMIYKSIYGMLEN